MTQCTGGGQAPVFAEAADSVPPRRRRALFPSDHLDPIAVLLDQGLWAGLRADDRGAEPPAVDTEFLGIARRPEPAQLAWLRRKDADRPGRHVVQGYDRSPASAAHPDG